ncbi:hypothetical protein LRS74_22025 [Streptomyces sp. LX-29]|uniref:hypothetical protein n=1 Tax=Streptomyces sp. LX-29 TaxID=2900152 RepID=UPI00240E0D73|nr:hypothetical protein [Streptomyces sp. LX-29]WFB09421.1 hypothetical protein LRS74_22025 [Streptomyces sp. LX-29]
MLNPINAEGVIRDGGAVGRFPGEIHEGVAWWVGACLVVVTKAARIAVAHDGHPTSTSFHERLCRGAMNAEHYACRVMDLRAADEAALLAATNDLGSVPGVMVTTTATEEGETVRIAVYDAQGCPLAEEAGLAKIRRLIAEDRVPIPVNADAKGRVELYPFPPQGVGK